ncbi:uncharacterized protein [Choristoneura fumiferana]|uniref:uncharacterized protein n=1 Tax=Choristoneura fumiferana TaxID=7141 RepID=UPI003D15360C
MLKCFTVNIMHQYAPAFIVVCILLCLSFNYTFPLHRETKEWYSIGLSSNRNRSLKCDSNYRGTTDRTKKFTLNDPTELSETNTLQNYTALYTNKPTKKNKLSDADLRQYEQLVIMKKYPYLDLKELELKYHPSSGKNVRQNPKFAPEPELGAGEPGICESVEEGPNVEIHNRGSLGSLFLNHRSMDRES